MAIVTIARYSRLIQSVAEIEVAAASEELALERAERILGQLNSGESVYLGLADWQEMDPVFTFDTFVGDIQCK